MSSDLNESAAAVCVDYDLNPISYFVQNSYYCLQQYEFSYCCNNSSAADPAVFCNEQPMSHLYANSYYCMQVLAPLPGMYYYSYEPTWWDSPGGFFLYGIIFNPVVMVFLVPFVLLFCIGPCIVHCILRQKAKAAPTASGADNSATAPTASTADRSATAQQNGSKTSYSEKNYELPPPKHPTNDRKRNPLLEKRSKTPFNS